MKKIVYIGIALLSINSAYGMRMHDHAVLVENFDDLNSNMLSRVRNNPSVYYTVQFQQPHKIYEVHSVFMGPNDAECEGIDLKNCVQVRNVTKIEAVKVRVHTPEEYASQIDGSGNQPAMLARHKSMVIPPFNETQESKELSYLMGAIAGFLNKGKGILHNKVRVESDVEGDTVYTCKKGSEKKGMFNHKNPSYTVDYTHDEISDSATQERWLGLYQANTAKGYRYTTSVTHWQSPSKRNEGLVIMSNNSPEPFNEQKNIITSRGCGVMIAACLCGAAALYTWLKG